MHIFTDTSIDHKLNIAIGSYLFLTNINEPIAANAIEFVQFPSRSSTIAEMTTISYIFDRIDNEYSIMSEIYLYTDCLSIVSLMTTRKNRIHPRNAHYQFYQHLIAMAARLRISFIWTKGHTNHVTNQQNHQIIFSYVDKHSRRTLRACIKENRRNAIIYDTHQTI